MMMMLMMMRLIMLMMLMMMMMLMISMLQGPRPAPVFEKVDMLGLGDKDEEEKDLLDPESLLGPKTKYKPQKEDRGKKDNDTEVTILIFIRYSF